MKTRKAFFEDFFKRLTEQGFSVKQLYENDIAAEVYAGPGLFCVITQDGDVIYEGYDADQARLLEQAAGETRAALDFCADEPFAMIRHETVKLTHGVFHKALESAGAAMLCRYSELFGYEFITCSKASGSHNKRPYYREMLFYDPQKAHNSFLERSGFQWESETPMLDKVEREIVLDCCNRRVMLDNELDTGTEIQIRGIIQKIEATLPEQTTVSPRQFYLDERN